MVDDLVVPVHCPNRFRHLTSSKWSATISVRSEDLFDRNFDHIGAVVDHKREVDRPFR